MKGTLNRNFDAANTTTLGSCPQQQCNPTISTTNNRFASGQGYNNDSAGNTTLDTEGRQFTYDADNKLNQIKDINNNIIAQNFYDGDGNRIKTISSTGSTVFVYDAAGQLVEEYTGQTLQTSYVYVGGHLLATETTTGTNYLTSDYLGTPRINTDSAGNVTSRRDYYPFGDEILAVGARSDVQPYLAADNVRQKFTGQQRDEDVKLDYFNARHYAFSLGRFISADNFGGKLSNPQTLNLYAYALNNPIKWVDPTGHRAEDPDDYCSDCYIDANGYLHRKDGSVWQAPLENVTVSCNCSDKKSTSKKKEPPPDLPDSPVDLIPVIGSGRRMLYNMNCNNGGGCNINRAVGNFIHTSIDAATLVEGLWKIGGKLFAEEVTEETTEVVATDIVTSDASSVNARDALNSKLGELESAQANAVQTRTLPDGRVRYSGPEIPASKIGPSRGAAHVTEYNPRTGTVRSWRETRGYSGEVRRVHPKTLNGQQIPKAPYYPR